MFLEIIEKLTKLVFIFLAKLKDYMIFSPVLGIMFNLS